MTKVRVRELKVKSEMSNLTEKEKIEQCEVYQVPLRDHPL